MSFLNINPKNQLNELPPPPPMQQPEPQPIHQYNQMAQQAAAQVNNDSQEFNRLYEALTSLSNDLGTIYQEIKELKFLLIKQVNLMYYLSDISKLQDRIKAEKKPNAKPTEEIRPNRKPTERELKRYPELRQLYEAEEEAEENTPGFPFEP